jgi:hypothetical protein
MSHYHTEVVIPPTDDIEGAIDKLMAPFNEQCDEEDGDRRHAFWDWFVIGGRWSGEKMVARLGEDKLTEFHKKLAEMKLTVSGVVAGKETISPPEQIPAVDALWREHFPGAGDVCPLFDHYKGGNVDVCTVADLPERLNAFRVIVANAEGYATFMLAKEIWNGVTWQDSAFDGLIKPVTDLFQKGENWPYTQAKVTPDWLVVTVDYHS